MNFKFTLAAASLSCAAILASPAPATEGPGYDGSKLRVHLAEKLTVLSQQVASAGCRLGGMIGTTDAREDLARSQNRFNRILDALEHGSINLGVPTAEKYAIARRSIANVRAVWAQPCFRPPDFRATT